MKSTAAKTPVWVIAILTSIILSLTSCSKKVVPTTIAYRSNKTEIITSDPSGSVTLRVWGEGLNSKAARINAAKKAIEEVTFSGVTGPHNAVMAVIPSPTARARYREYFNKFFKDNGKYKKYVKAEKPEKDEYLNGNGMVVVPVVVTIDREGLIKQFTKDKVTE